MSYPLLIVLCLIGILSTGCSDAPANKQTSLATSIPAPVASDTTGTKQKNTSTSAPPLIEYLQSLKPLAQEVEKEFKTIRATKGVTDEIRQNHQTLDEKIKKIDITGTYYPNHTKLSGHVALAHKYNIYLWQAYQNNNSNDINETTEMIKKELSDFKIMAGKIDAGQIKEIYEGPNK